MTITFLSNYINHHQIPFCTACAAQEDVDFVFIQTEEVEEERLRMGWSGGEDAPAYVVKLAGNENFVRERVLHSDIVLAGWAPRTEHLVQERLDQGGITFRISERIYKDGQWRAISPRGLVSKYREHTRHRRKPYYLLGAGAYVGSDFTLIGAFPEKKYRWGYFPPVRSYEDGELERIKEKAQAEDDGVTQMLWAGRFVDFKHIEIALRLANNLRECGENFRLHVVGDGDAMDRCLEYVRSHDLEEKVIFHGFCPPDAVRGYMEQCRIFVFTSDHGEGWGAVVNEAMNSGCAVIAGSEAGCVPFLIRHGENGYIYSNEDETELLSLTRKLLHDEALQRRFGGTAQTTIRDEWNGQQAAQRLIAFCKALREGTPLPTYSSGPMSTDPCLKPFLTVRKTEIVLE